MKQKRNEFGVQCNLHSGSGLTMVGYLISIQLLRLYNVTVPISQNQSIIGYM